MRKPSKSSVFTLLLLVFISLAYVAYRSSAAIKAEGEVHQIACDQGNAKACEILGTMHAKGQGFQQSHVKSRGFFQKSCDLGNAELCEYLGKIYKNGERVHKDLFKAFESYKKSCELGRKNGCYNLGMMYSDGRGTRQNDVAAEKAFLKACELGGAQISYLVGIFYSGKGQVNQQYFTKASEHLKKGCAGREAKACNDLALQYAMGQGVAQDKEMALEYYGKSCDLENGFGCRKYAELKISMN